MTFTQREQDIKRAEGLITQAQTLIDGLCADAAETGAALAGSAHWAERATALEAISDKLDDAREACSAIDYNAPQPYAPSQWNDEEYRRNMKPQAASPLAFLLVEANAVIAKRRRGRK